MQTPDILEVSNIEVLKGIAAPVALPSDKTSIDVSILLNGICDVNGAPLLFRTQSASKNLYLQVLKTIDERKCLCDNFTVVPRCANALGAKRDKTKAKTKQGKRKD